MAQLPSPSHFGDYGDWPGRDVLDSGGERLGGVREIYLDRETRRPEWVLVEVEGGDARFVPLADAAVESSAIRVAHSATTIRDAPGIGSEPRIDQSEERRLYAHYGLGYSEEESGSGLPSDEPPASWSDAAPAIDAPAPREPPSPPAELSRAAIPEPPIAAAASAGFAAGALAGRDAASAADGPDGGAARPDPAAPLASGPGTAPPAVPVATGPVARPDPAPPGATGRVTGGATPPPRSSSPPEPEGGALAVIRSRPAGIVAGVALVALLLLIVRRLR